MAPILSIVVPVRNEADNVLPLIEEIHAALDGGEAFEVIYVDDGSIDETAGRLGDAASRFPLLRVVTHGQSCGQSAAIRSGVDSAQGAWIVTLDGDGQNDPADIPALVRLALDAPPGGPDMVAGIRAQRRDSWFKRLMSRIANGVRQWLLRDNVSDTGCGLKVIRRSLFLQLPYFDHMHRYLPALVLRAGGRVETIPVGHRPRLAGRSKYGLNNRLWVGIVDLLGVMWLLRRHKTPVIENSDKPDDA
jgi:dolichol-phosphate mannosyltransferase